MQYPLIDRQLLSYLRFFHGGFNTFVMIMFFYHAHLGIAIRRARRARGPLPFPMIKRHRKGGPLLAALGITGFCIGFTLVMLDSGKVLQFPFHFLVGCTIVLSLITTFVVSRKIKGPDSSYRTPHFYLGIAILCLYLIEVFLGIGVLL
jgi:hypothetical protein